MHPKRPPSLEVRPHPLRGAQIGRFLKTVVTAERQLWAGSENGAVRVWDFRDLYGKVLRVRRKMQRCFRDGNFFPILTGLHRDPCHGDGMKRNIPSHGTGMGSIFTPPRGPVDIPTLFKEVSSTLPSASAAVMCMVGDEGSGLVWSGHRDGRVRCWRMYSGTGSFKEGFSWQAHHGPVLSMVITSYGQFFYQSFG
ncbi:hypothetical protein SLEP1_g46411 [Rubroshorea leprosula]|uniref:IP5PC-F beta-propeller domain-containing protein n=1 Tax=Rubroshorea leprosula TaxID=152421 RepID=A0AAV5LP33_9ROSI|nr:hypothetical protein SLEP1_g46411 [Rubroshorea leprosula]